MEAVFISFNGTTTITDSTISGNTAGSSGGGLLVSGTTTIVDSIISGNSIVDDLDAQDGVTTAQGITIASAAFHSSGPGGGGIYAGGIMSISGSTISGNSAVYGGGINIRYSTTTIVGSTISRNSAELHGGGIFARSSTINIRSNTISENSAINGGGIWGGTFGDVGDVTATITQSTISGNSAVADGGGLRVSGDVVILQSTIATNIADTGGGLFFGGGTATIDHTILASNRVRRFGLGPDLTGLFGSVLDVHFSLIGDERDSGLIPAPVGSPDANGNIIGGFINPLLGPLADNGGPTPTHALLPGSPAINAGDPLAQAGIDDVPLFDQRGVPFRRVADGRIDIGAFEVQTGVPILLGDYNHDEVVDAADYTVWRDTLGSTTNLDADGSGNGVVDQADYDFWKANFGNTTVTVNAELGSGSAESGAKESEPEALATVAVSVGDVKTLDNQAHDTESRATVSLDAETVTAEAARPTFGIHDDLLLLALDRVGRIRNDDSLPVSNNGRGDNTSIRDLDADPLAVALAEWL